MTTRRTAQFAHAKPASSTRPVLRVATILSLCGGGLAGAVLSSTAHAQVLQTTIAYSGQPAPGLGQFTFTVVGEARLSDTYDAAFWADLGPSLPDSTDGTFWIDRGAGAVLAAREGQNAPAPGVAGLVSPQLSGLGLLSFTAALVQDPANQPTRAGYVAGSEGSFTLLDAEPTPNPSPFVTISPLPPRSDEEGITAYLLGTTLKFPAGQIAVGAPAPTGSTTLPPGSLFRRFSPPTMSPAGDVAFRAWAGDLPDPTTWRSGLWIIRDGQTTPEAVIAEGDQVSGTPLIINDLGAEPAIDQDGRVVYSARLALGTDRSRTGIYRAEPGGSTTELLRSGLVFPGIDGGVGVVSRSFSTNARGDVVTRVQITGAGDGATGAILKVDPAGAVTQIARTGQPFADVPGAFIRDVIEPRVNQAGGVAYTVLLTSNGGPVRAALVASARAGAPAHLINTIGGGFALPNVTPSPTKTVRSLTFDHRPQPSGLAQFVGRSLVYKLSFADESTAVLRADLPQPQPLADITLDGELTLEDFFAFFNAFSASKPPADIDGVRGVDLEDFFLFLNEWAAQ